MGISPRDFQQMQTRMIRATRGAGRTAGAGAGPSAARVPDLGPDVIPRHAVILGVDPSLRGTGYGVIHWTKAGARMLAQGTVRCSPTWQRSRCLLLIHQTLRDVLREHQPTVCVVESLFYAQNFQTTLIMGEARGAGLVAVAEAGLDIFEIAPRKVKQAMVGYGAAQKLAVAKMVQRLLGLDDVPDADAADALALALTFAQETGRHSLTPQKRV